MAAVAASKVSAPPSSFSTLLRRSKFASYDPSIGQVYASYGGSVPRGDWGLKRPLAIRRKDTRITVKNLDTIYQQTEWDNATTDTMLLRKFEDLKVTPKPLYPGTWNKRCGHGHNTFNVKYYHDSDLVEQPTGKLEAELKRAQPLPDPMAMNEKRFKRYLRRVRRLGPEFEAFLEGERDIREVSGANGPPPSPLRADGPPLHIGVRDDSKDHSRFLAKKFAEMYEAKDSTMLRPFPHPLAGMTYARSNELQTAIDTEPAPGRALHRQEERRKPQKVANVAFAGWIGSAPLSSKDNSPTMMDWGTDDRARSNKEAGMSHYKPFELLLNNPPEVVGKKPQRIESQNLNMRLIQWTQNGISPERRHRPGSTEYITREEEQRRAAFLPSSIVKDYNRSGKLSKFSGRKRNEEADRAAKAESQAKANALLENIKGMIPGKAIKDEDLD